MAAKENERMMEKNDYQRKKEKDAAEKKAIESKKYKMTDMEDADEDEDKDKFAEDDDGFTTIEDNKTRANQNKQQKGQQKY